MKKFTIVLLVLALGLMGVSSVPSSDSRRFVHIKADSQAMRSELNRLGVSIEFVRSDGIWGFVSPSVLERVQHAGFEVLGNFDAQVGRGGHEGVGTLNFPAKDARFHNYEETRAALKDMVSKHADITRLHLIGKSLEGREMLALQINTEPESLLSGRSNKPGAIFMGNHHAREHLSLEIPLMMAQYLLDHLNDPKIAKLVDSRDIWFIPMVNPDGAEYDIARDRYEMWRKNRRNNGNGTYGVDLNRNYGYEWGTGGSSDDPSSDVYMGPKPFSEPETQVIRDFVEAHLNAKVLLTFHTFSELVLYPWGHSNDPIPNQKDRDVFVKMAKTMAAWNGYTPEQASDLYIASGDTTDWAYGTHGIFAFTFELSPTSMFNGGFYPGAGVIDKVFDANLKPVLYMIDLADDPYRALSAEMDPAMFYEIHPLPKLKI